MRANMGRNDSFEIVGGVLRVPLSLRFGGEVKVGAAQIGEALVALDSAVRTVAPALAKTAGMPPARRGKAYCALSVDELRRGSLGERLIVDVFLGGNEQAHEFVRRILAGCQSGDPKVVTAVVGAVILALITGGALYAIRKYSRGKKDTAMITAHNSVVVYAAGKLNLSESAFREMIQRFTGRPSFAKDSTRALRPGLSTEGGGLTVVSGGERFRVEPEAFSELPTEEELEAEEASQEFPFEDTELTVLASDIQRNRQGWAAELPVGHPYAGVRVRMELADEIPLDTVMYRPRIRCGGVIHLAVNRKNGTFRPVKIVVRKVASGE